MEELKQKIEKLEQTTSSFIEYTRGVFGTIFEVLEDMNGNLNKMQGDIAAMSAKIENIDGNTNKGFGKMHSKMDDLKSEIQKINKVTGYKDILDNEARFKA